MAERNRASSIPPEELHGSVQVVTEPELEELRERFQGKQFDPELLTAWHDSQAGQAYHYGGTPLFLEADDPGFDVVKAVQTLLGLN
jgi:hypothetical protein